MGNVGVLLMSVRGGVGWGDALRWMGFGCAKSDSSDDSASFVHCDDGPVGFVFGGGSLFPK